MGSPTQVEMPDGNVVEFPEGMPDSEIKQHVQTYIGNKGAQSPIPPPAISKLRRPAPPAMHESYLMGDENEDPNAPTSGHDLRSTATDIAKTVYSPSAPNIATQFLKKAKGQPYDLTTPVENAIGMMAGEEGLVSGGADAAAATAPAARAAAPTVEAGTERSSISRSFSKGPSASSGAAAGAAGTNSAPAASLLKMAGQVVSPRAMHAMDFASTLLRRIRGDNGGEAAAGAAGPTAAGPVETTLAPHESTAIPQSFRPTGGYSVSGRPVGSTQEWLGANRPPAPSPPPRPAPAWKSQPNVGVDQGGHSVKDVLVKAQSLPQPSSSWVADPARGISSEEWNAGHDIAAEPDRPNTLERVRAASTKLAKKAPALADDAAMATKPATKASSTESEPAAKRVLRKKPGK